MRNLIFFNESLVPQSSRGTTLIIAEWMMEFKFESAHCVRGVWLTLVVRR